MNKFLYNFFFIFKKDVKSVILAVFLSIIIWFAISLQLFPDVINKIDNIPVYTSPTNHMQLNNLQLAENYQYTTNIKIEGKRYDIGNITAEDVSAYLDFSVVTQDGNYDIPVVVTVSRDVNYSLSQSLSSVNVDIIKMASKTLKVEPLAVNIDITEGFEVDNENLKTNPDSITITGEYNDINAITRIVAKAIPGSLLTATTEVPAELIYYNNNVILQNSRVNANNLDFNVVVPIHKVKTLPIEFSILGYQQNFDINSFLKKMSVYPPEITISAPDNSIDSLEVLELAQINLNELDYYNLRTTRRETIAPILPEGYRNISKNPSASLTFKDIENYNESIFILDSQNFSVINPPSDYDVDILTKELSVKIVGPLNFVRTLTTKDITVTLNLMGVEPNPSTKMVNVTCKITGDLVPAWVAGNPQVDVMFTRK